MKRLSLSIVLLLASGSVPRAWAQSFQPANPWQPLPCGIVPMTDPLRDQAGAVDERDLVGDANAPAGLSAWDPTFLYLQLRLDGDPAPGGKLKPFAWGFELSLDNDTSTYELLIVLNGLSGNLEVSRNTSSSRSNDPADPADQPLALSYPFTSHARVASAPDSNFGGNPDYLVSLAVPWADLQPLGLRPLTPALIWAGSSSNGDSLNGDLACHDGSSGTPLLAEVGGVATVFDVSLDTDGDQYPDWYEVRFGTDPANPAVHPAGEPPAPGSGPGILAIEGGGGCQVAGGRYATVVGGLLLLGAGMLLARRARRRRTRG